MDKNGKMFDVIIEENIGRDNDTGLPKFFGLIVWAEAGIKDILKNIPGIHWVHDFGTCYFVDLDPRYNKEFLMAEIEAQVKINSGEK